uniref:TTI1 C-terminal TPR domain-containing protein n=2 Tax=Pyxicephalus adspersus TaxID=30357 RepID=A0AAV3A960_PYXAD|nr:TPA: hypothetical protein GDO54_008238 [Pyxicephalus adspersus]
MFLRIFVEHMNDERPEVKEKTHKILKEIEKDEIISLTLGEVLSDSLHSLFVSLPRTLSAQDDQGKFQILAHLIGYLQMLGPRLTFTLQSSAHLYRLSSALMQILELDPCEVKVVEEKPPSSVANLTQENIEHTQSRLKNFRSFRDPQILTLLHQVCRLLGYYGDFYLLTDHFLDLYRSQRLPALVVLNQLVLGAAGVQIESFHSDRKNFEPAELVNAVRPILEEYIDPVNWDICTGQGSNEVVDQLADQMASIQIGQKPNLVLRELTNNIWKLCLQLEGISCIAQALGPNFRQLLICSLYPLLEKAGDTSLLVRDTALLALAQVREACGYTDIGHLVEQNADYLASEISLGLRRLQRHEGSAVKVLQVLLDNSSPSLLPMLSDLVQDLLPALDQSQNEGAKMLFPVLNCLVTKIGTWFLLPEVAEEPSLTDASNESEVPSENMACEMKEFLLDHIQNYRLARGEVEEEDDDVAEMSPPPDEDKEEEKPPMLTHVKICIEVAEKCTHFLSHSNVHIRVQALDTLRLSLLPTRSQRDILLPMAYKAWPSLVKRLTQDEPLVLLRAFEVLVSLTSSCKDFLRHRMCKDAFPAFLTYLRSQALVSCHAGAVYNHMLGYKLQKAILEGLGKLCLDLDLGDNNILEVIDSCMLYLSARQPKKLQEAAIRTFLFLSKLDPDIVWLHLCEWQSPPQPPHFCLVPVPWKAKPNDEYTQNIQLLLKNLQ